MYSMPGGFVQRQVNTSLHIPRPKKTQSQPKPENRACQTQKDRELIISVNNRPLSEKVPHLPVFFSLPSFPLERALLCERASEIPTCKSFSRMSQTTLNFSSNIFGAFPLVLTSPTARPRAWPPSSGGEELKRHASSGHFSKSGRKQMIYTCFVSVPKELLLSTGNVNWIMKQR